VARRLNNFTVTREPIEVPIGGDEFVAYPLLAPTVVGAILDRQQTFSDLLAEVKSGTAEMHTAMTKVIDTLAEVFDLMLEPDSAQRFRDRLYSKTAPLDLYREVIPAMQALVEEYTDRPTQPSSSSSTGPATTGGVSTDGAPPTASSLLDSTPLASAT